MKPTPLPTPRILLTLGAILLAASCASQPPAEDRNKPGSSFARVKPVLERNCVHCHAAIRLPGMPSLTDTKALASLIGPGKLIVPGKPEQSRFYLVTTLSDEQAGAMPPTGHAMNRNEVTILREWILGGAELPDDIIKFNPVGVSPRSR
jgi:mono/diheme cytochrome c family protein